MFRAIFVIMVLDMMRFFTEVGRLLFGLIQPLLYLFVLGAGMGGGPEAGTGYQQFIFPGAMGLAIFFAATNAAMAIVFDRQLGYLKSVLAAPIPRLAIAIGKIAAGGLQGLLQGLVLLPFAPMVGVHLSATTLLTAIGTMTLASITFSAIGLAVASRFKSIIVYPVVSNIIALPAYFLSGSLFSLSSAPEWMQKAAYFNPVAYSVDLIRSTMFTEHFFPVSQAIWVQAVTIVVLVSVTAVILSRGEET